MPSLEADSLTQKLQTIAITGRNGAPVHTTSHLIRGRGVSAQHGSWGYGFQNSVPVACRDVRALTDLELHVAGVRLHGMFAPHCRVVRSQNQHQHAEPRLEVLVVVAPSDEQHHLGGDDEFLFDDLPSCVAVGLELFPCTEAVCRAAGLGQVRDSVSWEQLTRVVHRMVVSSEANEQQEQQQLMVEFIGVQFPIVVAAELLWKGIANLPPPGATSAEEDLTTTRTNGTR